MPKENQSDGRAHDCDHEQIFCAHGHIHEHRKSRVIGVLMAMCTSKPIIGKRAPRASPRHAATSSSAFQELLPKIPARQARHCGCSAGEFVNSNIVALHPSSLKMYWSFCRSYRNFDGALKEAGLLLHHLHFPASLFSAHAIFPFWSTGAFKKGKS